MATTNIVIGTLVSFPASRESTTRYTGRVMATHQAPLIRVMHRDHIGCVSSVHIDLLTVMDEPVCTGMTHGIESCGCYPCVAAVREMR
jgi:hypothetical protein